MVQLQLQSIEAEEGIGEIPGTALVGAGVGETMKLA